MHVAVDARAIGPISQEIQRVARDAILNSDAPLSTLTNALEAMSESGIGGNIVSRTLSKQNETTTDDDAVDSIDDEELRKEFPDELYPVPDPKAVAISEEKQDVQKEIPSSSTEQTLESPQSSNGMERSSEVQVDDSSNCVINHNGSNEFVKEEEENQIHPLSTKTKFAWKATRIEQIVEKIIEILYADLIPETMQTILSNLAATFIAVSILW